MVEPRPYHPALTIDVNKFAVAGCWHANLGWAERSLQSAQERGADVLIHTGDFGYTYSERFIRGIEWLTTEHIPIGFIDGNHDYHRYLHSLRGVEDGSYHLTGRANYLPRAYRWSWGGVTFMALGGARSVDRARRTLDESKSLSPAHRDRDDEYLWWDTETITAADKVLATAHGPVDVLVSHDAPTGVVIPGFQQYSRDFYYVEVLAAQAHRQVLRTIVDDVKPKLIIHGHYHAWHTQTVDFGYGPVKVIGLDRDGTSNFRSTVVLDIDDVLRWVTT